MHICVAMQLAQRKGKGKFMDVGKNEDAGEWLLEADDWLW